MPFVRFLNVGGNSENKANSKVCPAIEAPLVETKKEFVAAV